MTMIPDNFPPDDTWQNAPHTQRKTMRTSYQLLALAAIPLLALIGLFLLTLVNEDDRISIRIEIDATPYTLTTTHQTVAEMLTEQQIAIEAGDVLNPGLNTPLEDGITVQITRARTVSLTIDGQTSVIRTPFSTVSDILRYAGVDVNPADQITIDGRAVNPAELSTLNTPAQQIIINHALPVRITDRDETIRLHTTGKTVGEALNDAGITLFLADTVTPDVTTPLDAHMEISVQRARTITIQVDNNQIEGRTNSRTVGQALAEAGIALMGLDYAQPEETSPITEGMTITVIRVRESLLDELQVVPYETVYQADPDLPIDQRRILQEGQDGVTRRVLRVRYENDTEISRTLEVEVSVSEHRDHMIVYGTKIEPRTVNTPDGPMEYWRKMRMYASSYHPAAVGGNTVTATGRTLTKGVVGIDPDIIPYGTMIYVEGYGVGIAADTGIPRANPYWIEFGYDDENFINWHEWVDVYILTPIPEEIDYWLPVAAQGGVIP